MERKYTLNNQLTPGVFNRYGHQYQRTRGLASR